MPAGAVSGRKRRGKGGLVTPAPRFASPGSSWAAGKAGAWRRSGSRPRWRRAPRTRKRRPGERRRWGRGQQSFSTPSSVSAPPAPRERGPLDTQKTAASHGCPHTNGRRGGSCGKCSSGSELGLARRPQFPTGLGARAGAGLRRGRGVANGSRGGSNATPPGFAGVPRAVSGVPRSGSGRGARFPSADGCAGVGGSPNCGLGGERPAGGGCVPSPLVPWGASPGPRPCAWAAALQGCVLGEERWKSKLSSFPPLVPDERRTRLCQIERSCHSTVPSRVTAPLQNGEAFSTPVSGFTSREWSEHLCFGAVGVRGYIHKRTVIWAERRQGLEVAWCAFPR